MNSAGAKGAAAAPEPEPIPAPAAAPVTEPTRRAESEPALTPAPAPATATAIDWVVCLCAQWCGACREWRPTFEAVARAHPQWRFAWVDIEDHADIADDFEVETFPTLLIAGADGTRFIGPVLPHAETLSRLLGALPAAQPVRPEVQVLLAALSAAPDEFDVRPR